MESDQTERGSSGKSVLTVAPQHEVWGGQSLWRELSGLTAVLGQHDKLQKWVNIMVRFC